MSPLAHPGVSVPAFAPTRRHLSLVQPGTRTPSLGDDAEQHEVARVLAFPKAGAPALDSGLDFAAGAVSTRGKAAVQTGLAADVSATPLRLTVRGRRLLAALAIAAAAVVGSIAGSVLQASASLPTDVETVTVLPGQSLWSIATGIAGPNEDVREVVGQIVALNDLQGHGLAAGQELTVPSGD